MIGSTVQPPRRERGERGKETPLRLRIEKDVIDDAAALDLSPAALMSAIGDSLAEPR